MKKKKDEGRMIIFYLAINRGAPWLRTGAMKLPKTEIRSLSTKLIEGKSGYESLKYQKSASA